MDVSYGCYDECTKMTCTEEKKIDSKLVPDKEITQQRRKQQVQMRNKTLVLNTDIMKTL